MPAKTIHHGIFLPLLFAVASFGVSTSENAWSWGSGASVAPVTGVYRCGMNRDLFHGLSDLTRGRLKYVDDYGFFPGEKRIPFVDLGTCVLAMPNLTRMNCYNFVKNTSEGFDRNLNNALYGDEKILRVTWHCETQGKNKKDYPDSHSPFVDGRPVWFGQQEVLGLRSKMTEPSRLALPAMAPQHVEALQKALLPTAAAATGTALLLQTLKQVGLAVLGNATNACGILFIVPITPMMQGPIFLDAKSPLGKQVSGQSACVVPQKVQKQLKCEVEANSQVACEIPDTSGAKVHIAFSENDPEQETPEIWSDDRV